MKPRVWSLCLAWIAIAVQGIESQAQDSSHIVSERRYELRGVWIATAFGIDFPKTTNAEQQKQHLDSIFQDLKARKFNAVFFQVRIRADVLFETDLEPYHEYLTGVYGKVPDYDVVQYALNCSRKYGLEFHAWFNTMILRGKNATKKSVGVPSLWERHPEWIDVRAALNPDEPTAYLNPANPHVQAHLLKLILNFARRYDIDGIQLDDYLRYPSTTFSDTAEFRRYNPRKLALDEWRRSMITQFVETLYDSLMQLKPYLKFGVTPIGVYRRLDNEPVMESYALYQDSREWTRRKACDYLAPQLYFHIGKTTQEEARTKQFNPDFAKLLADWCANKNFRHLYVGLGVYKPSVKKEWREQLALVRQFGAEGVIFYPYSATAGIEAFEDYACIPPMTWKKSTLPEAPQHIRITKQNGVVQLSWQAQPNARWYNLYEQQGNTLKLIRQHIFVPEIQIDIASGRRLFLTTIDRFGIESTHSAPVEIP